MVVLGYADTTAVTMADIGAPHASRRPRPRHRLLADLPLAYDTVEDALKMPNDLAAGAEAVKAEGGRAILDQVKAIVKAGIPFLAISVCCRNTFGKKAATKSKESRVRKAGLI